MESTYSYLWILTCSGRNVEQFLTKTLQGSSNHVAAWLVVQVVVEKEWRHSGEVEFPAVTVCNTNPVKQSLLHLSPRMSALVDRWTSEDRKKRRRRSANQRVERCESAMTTLINRASTWRTWNVDYMNHFISMFCMAPWVCSWIRHNMVHSPTQYRTVMVTFAPF